jgi:SWI/SNF-related matrix-associated actin-dependent regulator of chromatin subfamily D
LFPGNDLIEVGMTFSTLNVPQWHNVGQNEVDGFEIKRTGNVETRVKLLLYPEHRPAQFKLSPPLAKLLNITTENRTRILMSVWQYIKVTLLEAFTHTLQMNKLHSPEDKKTIINNAQLKEVPTEM